MSDIAFWDIVMGTMFILAVALYTKLASCAKLLQEIHDTYEFRPSERPLSQEE